MKLKRLFRHYVDTDSKSPAYHMEFTKWGKFIYKLHRTYWKIEFKYYKWTGYFGYRLRVLFDCRRIKQVTFMSSSEDVDAAVEIIKCDELSFPKLIIKRTGSIVSVKGAGKYYGDNYNSYWDKLEMIVDLRNPAIIGMVIYREGDEYVE